MKNIERACRHMVRSLQNTISTAIGAISDAQSECKHRYVRVHVRGGGFHTFCDICDKTYETKRAMFHGDTKCYLNAMHSNDWKHVETIEVEDFS